MREREYKDYSFKDDIKAIYFPNLSKIQALEILKVRNEEHIRKQCLNQDLIDQNSHLAFVYKKNKKHAYFAFLKKELFLGVCSLVKIKKDECFLGIYSSKKHKLAHKMLAFTEDIAKDLGIARIYLDVSITNPHAQSFFLRSGYKEIGEKGLFRQYLKKL